MTTKDFKNEFSLMCSENGFNRSYGKYYKEFDDSIVVVFLQKSNFGSQFYFHMKVFIQGFFNENFILNKELIKRSSSGGSIDYGGSKKYRDLFNLENEINDQERIKGLKSFFKNDFIPFVFKSSSKLGLKEIIEDPNLDYLPSIKNEFLRMMNNSKMLFNEK